MNASIALVALALCGCHGGDKAAKRTPPEQVKKEWAAKLQAKLEKIAAAAKLATTADLAAPGVVKPALDFDGDDATKHPNAIAVQLDDADLAARPKQSPDAQQAWDSLANADPSKAPPLPPVPHPHFEFQNDSTSNRVFEAKQLLGIEESRIADEWYYDQLVNAKYVLVVAPGEVQWPTTEGTDLVPGQAPFRAMLVDIDSGKPLGGFEGVAKGSSSIKVAYDRDHPLDDSASRKLADDLMEQYSKAIIKGIQDRWPGSKTPVLAWGY